MSREVHDVEIGKEESNHLPSMSDNFGPMFGQLSTGGVFGYCSGYALQTFGR